MEYVIDHIPVDGYKHKGIKIIPKYLTIHSTANLKSTAQNERDWLVNEENKHQASWHIVVDESSIIEAIPLDELAFHAGDDYGNVNSIGLEICESGDREKTLNNAVKLTAKLLKERNWGVDKLKRHFDWSGKICPRIFADNEWAEWEAFKANVEKELNNDIVKVKLNGVICELNGFLKEGINYVPIREIARLFGYNVDWQNEIVVFEKRVDIKTIKDELDGVKISIDKLFGIVGGE